jgi:EpsI family protein
MSVVRALVASMLMVAAGVVAAARPSADERPDVAPLTIGAWTGVDQPPLDAETERILGADAYIDREYTAPGRAAVGLYVAYYAQQRPGASIHSPLHCLPGTGWEPTDVTTLTVERPDGTLGTVRRMIVRKHLDQALVLYWYAIHGRMLANEFASKAWLIRDGIALGRSDASLVRIVVPIRGSADAAQRDALAFAGALIASHP